MPTPKVLVFAGSTRRDAYSCRVANAVVLLLEAAGGKVTQVTHVNLADFDMPIYNGDHEAAEGLPTSVRKLQRLIAEHEALLMATGKLRG